VTHAPHPESPAATPTPHGQHDHFPPTQSPAQSAATHEPTARPKQTETPEPTQHAPPTRQKRPAPTTGDYPPPKATGHHPPHQPPPNPWPRQSHSWRTHRPQSAPNPHPQAQKRPLHAHQRLPPHRSGRSTRTTAEPAYQE